MTHTEKMLPFQSQGLVQIDISNIFYGIDKNEERYKSLLMQSVPERCLHYLYGSTYAIIKQRLKTTAMDTFSDIFESSRWYLRLLANW